MPKVKVYGLKPNRRKANLRGRLRKNHEHILYEYMNTKLVKVTRCKVCKFHHFS